MKCEECCDEGDSEYFRVKSKTYKGNIIETKKLCSVCTGNVWRSFDKQVLEIELIYDANSIHTNDIYFELEKHSKEMVR